MPTKPIIAQRAETLLGAPVVSTTAVAGGDICTATRMRLSDGRTVLAKTRPHPPAGFFEAEARGLGRLAATGAVAVPDVLAVDTDCVILSWVEPGRPDVESASTLGRSLSTLHAAPASFGADAPGFVGLLPLRNDPATSWPELYATRRVLPYLKLAVDRGQIEDRDAKAVDALMHRITEVAGPAEPAALLHGDLWSGNVVWAKDGPPHLIDAAAVHGGHRESDLAMLALFGLPQLQRVLEAYQEATPLAEGWEDRVPLHQLHPLLVHTAMFGASYGARAGDAARRML
ncbi:fructosamine kinase [Marmoricola endophyticus]|uniref:Fructosamine kinase n=1 Tax=Marmoricola endophyticus TaxID=2040280 RepID=A0A917BJF8_9ACTN|nr:fructosamine kinase family protein [Marmoricola endophyticus]GGF46146.1 fructosamine kinase [Marmoricola endophyticus]